LTRLGLPKYWQNLLPLSVGSNKLSSDITQVYVYGDAY
jgi:hypothetical protein